MLLRKSWTPLLAGSRIDDVDGTDGMDGTLVGIDSLGKLNVWLTPPLPPGEYRFPGKSKPGKERLIGGGAKIMLGV
jgi:hypothetical protein